MRFLLRRGFAAAALLALVGPAIAGEMRTTYRVCPAWAFKATVGLIADGMPAELAWTRWCYEIAMPYNQNPKHATDEPEWVIPYDSAGWIAAKINGEELHFEGREKPSN